MMVETIAGAGGNDSDGALDRFQSIWGGAWVPGRVTLTRLHLNFIPNRAGRGLAMLDLNLRDIHVVELSGGRVSKVMGLRTGTHLVNIRALGIGNLAPEIAQLAEAARKTPQRRR
ncbi:MAG: hypothetical protein CMH83_22910 [Nocardioides sp.]|nr:hypothetical protein [Nocardioides sp.]